MDRRTGLLPILFLLACFEDAKPVDDDGAAGESSTSSSSSDDSGSSTGGVPEFPSACDELETSECYTYAHRYYDCILDKLPADVQASSVHALDTSCEAWTAAEADGDPDLASDCVTASDAVKSSCGWD